MPKNVDIFVGSEAPIKTFVKEMETLLGIKLHAISDGEEIFYEFRDPQIVLTVGTHDFVNDRDMNFEDYRYDLSVRALNVSTEEHRKKWRDKFVRFVFQKLKASHKYQLMLVEDIQVKLEAFCPKSICQRAAGRRHADF
ncbi:hypothetical protein IH992_12395 [Candidatus Poribacteria bacterium]|nr:hypothetical protein [Candidatus Poribacteria bacterium]